MKLLCFACFFLFHLPTIASEGQFNKLLPHQRLGLILGTSGGSLLLLRPLVFRWRGLSLEVLHELAPRLPNCAGLQFLPGLFLGFLCENGGKRKSKKNEKALIFRITEHTDKGVN